MYTGLRVKVIVKPEWRGAIGLLHWSRDNPEPGCFDSGRDWDNVYSSYPDLPGLDKWSQFGRRDFIPFGGLTYMPPDFSEAEDGESYSEFDRATGEWRFCCSLKNYEGEIKFFIENVLAHIVEKVDYCESLYEEFPSYDEADWRKWTRKWLGTE